ncbi:hypothetical protein COCNU_03G004350 [Cocos nucifera]|uniref:Uncharacterized protein n=1 Tax=Cocos nucifera TaxID=13894 RepID=A0A8K0MYV0_COCNU|nr:hypothetical protein COCNU_03G004350 [Cocos nucifera]
MLVRDLLFTMMPQWDLNSRRRDLGLEELINFDFSSILDSAIYFRLFTEYMTWLFKNKKAMMEVPQSTKDYKKMAEKKAAKKAKVIEELKKQLQEKLATVKKKNKVLMDHQRKANEREKRLFKLQQEVSKIPELEAKVKELEEMVSSQDDMVAAQDKTLLVYQRDVERLKAAADRAVEDYKSSEAFHEEVTEALGKAFDCGFNNYGSLVGKLFPNLDLSGVTQEIGLPLLSKTIAQPSLDVAPPVDVPQPIPEVAPQQLSPAPIETSAPTEAPAVEIIPVEDDQATTPVQASRVNA